MTPDHVVDDLENQIAAKDVEIERLKSRWRDAEAKIGDASIKLKLLYMAAGLGRKTGHEALAALNNEISKIDAALEPKP